jgi:ribose 5-phosphate isomerase A
MKIDVTFARHAAATRAAELVEDGMRVGLGSGDTAAHAVRAIAARVAAGLRIVGVPTSGATRRLATDLGIPLAEGGEPDELDVTIDGADEIDGELRLIKGGGGALTRERLVARASRRLVIVADAGKRVSSLGQKWRLPVELVAFGAPWTMARLRKLGLEPELRLVDGAPFKTDGGGVIVDCAFPAKADLHALATAIKAEPGVVDHGFFLDEASVAYIGNESGVDVLERPRHA